MQLRTDASGTDHGPGPLVTAAAGTTPGTVTPRRERWLGAGAGTGITWFVRVGHGLTATAAAACLLVGLRSPHAVLVTVLAAVAAAGPLCLITVRAVRYREGRRAWACIAGALGLQLWGALFAAALSDVSGAGSGPGWRDVFTLPSMLLLGTGVFLLTQTSLGRVHTSVRLDGLTVGLSAACLATAAFAGPLLGRRGDDWSVSLALLYPVIDLILIVLLAAGLAPRRYRPTWSSGLLMAAVAIVAAGDVVRLHQQASSGAAQRPLHELTSLFGFALMALAAWAPGRYRRPVTSITGGHRHLEVPAASALAALIVLVAGPLLGVAPAASVMAAATVALALTRTLWTARHLGRLNERARRAHTDELTELPNRRAFFDQLDRRLTAPMVRHAVLVVDLDGFKAVNDTYGHGTGDELLRCVAHRLRARLPEQVAFARMGGDEFCAVAPVNSPEEAVLFGRTITAALREPFGLDIGVVAVGASCGVALQPEHGTTRADLLHAADVAMYDAKRHRKGVVLFQAGAHAVSSSQGDLVDDVRMGIEEGRVEVHFQPLARCSDGGLCGIEALARFRHPQQGLLDAATLLPLVEQAGGQYDLFGVVLRQALSFAAALRRQQLPIPVSVNVDAAVLRAPGLLHDLTAALSAAALPASLLSIEVSEAELARDPGPLAAVLGAVARSGIGVVIDGFEGGPACLDAFAIAAVHHVKVGPALAESIRRHHDGLVLLESRAAVAARFGASIGVVGAWDAAALDRFGSIGVSSAQGFGIGPPQHPYELLRDLAELLPTGPGVARHG